MDDHDVLERQAAGCIVVGAILFIVLMVVTGGNCVTASIVLLPLALEVLK
jgi:hypothetical protein